MIDAAGWAAVLLRLAYLGVTNAFAVLRLLPMNNRDKDVEILALRHQITVLERQPGKEKVRFDAGDRAFLAALLHRPPRDVAGADKSSGQVTSLIIDPGLSAAMPFAPAQFTWTADWRHHGLSCCCAWPTSL